MIGRLIPLEVLDVDTANVRVGQDSAMELDELARSIEDQGVLIPLIVRPLPDGRYGVVAGQRRLAAAQIAGLSEVPCVVGDLDDVGATVVSATENLARVNLDPITEGEIYRALLEVTGDTQADLAGRLGVAASTLSGRLKLLELPDDIREYVRDGTMSIGAAYAMVKKAGRARAQPRRRPHEVTEDDVEFLDVVAVADDLVRQVRRHIADHIKGDTISDFVARAVRRELARPSCHEPGCHHDALGGGRYCRRHFTAKATPPAVRLRHRRRLPTAPTCRRTAVRRVPTSPLGVRPAQEGPDRMTASNIVAGMIRLETVAA